MLADNRPLRDLFSRDVWWAEWWAAAAAIGWSMIAFFGEGSVTARPGLVRLSIMAPDRVWETLGVVLGTLHIAALVSGYKIARWFACFVMSAWWAYLTLAIMVQDPAAPSGALYTANAMICLTSLWKLRPARSSSIRLSRLWGKRKPDGK